MESGGPDRKKLPTPASNWSQMSQVSSAVGPDGAQHGSNICGRLSQLDISVKEMFPIVVVAAAWDDFWRGTSVICHCGNQVVVAVHDVVINNSCTCCSACFIMKYLDSLNCIVDMYEGGVMT